MGTQNDLFRDIKSKKDYFNEENRLKTLPDP